MAAVGLGPAFLDALLGISAAAGTASTTWVAVGLFVATTALLLVGKFNTLDKLVVPCKRAGAVHRGGGRAQRGLADPSRRGGMGPGHRGRRHLPDCVDGLDAHGGRLEHVEQHLDLERIKASGYRPTLRETLREFNLGYGVSAVLAFRV